MFTTAPFEAQYERAWPPPLRPQPDPVLMIEPPPAASMIGTTCLHIRKIERTFTPNTRSHSSTVVSTAVVRRMMPALLKTTFTPPSSWREVATTRSMSGSLATSAAIAMAVPPAARISCATASAASAFRSTTATGRALGGERERGGTTDAAGTAGDDGLLVLETHGVSFRVRSEDVRRSQGVSSGALTAYRLLVPAPVTIRTVRTGESRIQFRVAGVDEERAAVQVDELLLGGDDEERVVAESTKDGSRELLVAAPEQESLAADHGDPRPEPAPRRSRRGVPAHSRRRRRPCRRARHPLRAGNPRRPAAGDLGGRAAGTEQIADAREHAGHGATRRRLDRRRLGHGCRRLARPGCGRSGTAPAACRTAWGRCGRAASQPRRCRVPRARRWEALPGRSSPRRSPPPPAD